MINTSDEYKRIINQGGRSIYADIKVCLASGEILQIPQNKIRGLTIEDDVSGRSSFDIGAAIINQITLKVDNTDSAYSDKEFDQAEITVKIGLQLSETVEWLAKGIFTADPGDESGDVITIKAYDNMRKFDHAYADSNLIYPATLGQIVRDACDMCGVSFVTPASPAFDYVVDSRPSDETLTFREILHLVGQIACCWFRCDKNGAMAAGFFDLAAYEAEMESAFHKIDNLTSFSRSTEDVVITGVRIVQSEESGEKAYQSGADGYVLSVEHNQLIQGDSAQTVADMLGEKLIGLRFRKLTVSHQSNPSIEAGDLAVVTDRKGVKYKTLLTSTLFQLGGIQKSACNAEAPARKSVQRFSESTKAYVEMRKLLREETTAREIAVENLAKTLANSSGLFMTKEEMGDGSFIYYAHNKPTIEESDIVWLFTAEAIGISTDGGETYPYGFTVTGEMITRVLQADGINADWINSGCLTVKNSKGEIIFQADISTGKVIINADTVSVGGKKVATEEYANAIADNATNVLDDKLNQTEVFNRLTKNGTLQGLYMKDGKLYINGQYVEFVGATIGGWEITDAGLKKDVTMADGTEMRVLLQPPMESAGGNTWILSCQQKIDGAYYGKFVLKADGSAWFGGGSVKIDASGNIDFKNRMLLTYDGTIIWKSTTGGDYPAQITRQSDGSVTFTIGEPTGEKVKITKNRIYGLTTPTSDSDATNKAYVDAADANLQTQIDNILPYGGSLSGAFNIDADYGMTVGWYWCHPTANTTGTLPSSFIGEYGILEVLRTQSKTSGATMQRFTVYANGDTYIRWYVNAKWHDWYCISSSGKTSSQGSKASGGSWSIAESKLLPCKNLLFALKDSGGRISLTRVPISLISTTSTVYGLNPLFGGGGDTHKGWGDVTIVKSGTTVSITYNTRVQDAVSISNCTLYLER